MQSMAAYKKKRQGATAAIEGLTEAKQAAALLETDMANNKGDTEAGTGGMHKIVCKHTA